MFTTEIPVRMSRNRNSEYLPQRRKGRKVRRLRVKIIYKSFCPFPITLAPLRLGGRNSRLRVLSMPDYLRRPRKFLTIVIQRIFYSHSRRALLCVVITLVRDAIISISCARYLIHYPMNQVVPIISIWRFVATPRFGLGPDI